MATGRGRPASADNRRHATLRAVEDALAAEHAAVYGYGVVGGRVGDDRLKEAREGYSAHRARRDALVRTVRDLGGSPPSAAPAYALPFPVPDEAAAVRLAAELENRVAAVYADLVRASEGSLRRTAADALRDAAVRGVRWSGSSVAFPGLSERASDAPSPTASPSGDGDAM